MSQEKDPADCKPTGKRYASVDELVADVCSAEFAMEYAKNKSKISIPPLAEMFPFDYQGGGYFRRRGVAKHHPAEILHGQHAVERLYQEFTKLLNANSNPNPAAGV